jgi:predicted ATPase
MGYPDQALVRSQEAFTRAQELSHPFSLAYALSFAAIIHQHRGEARLAQARAEAAMALATEHGFPQWLAQSMLLRGWALAAQGRAAEGMAEMQQGMTTWRGIGLEVGRPYWLALLATAYLQVGQAEAGLETVTVAQEEIHRRGECQWAAGLWQLRGDCLLALMPDQQAEAAMWVPGRNRAETYGSAVRGI